MGWIFPLFSSLSVSLSLELTEKKAQNLTAEWLIQIIVAFSCIGLLSSLTLFFAFLPFHPAQCGIWATCELGPLSKRGRKKMKNGVTSEGRERDGSKNLNSPAIFSPFPTIACTTVTEKWINRRTVSLYTASRVTSYVNKCEQTCRSLYF